MNNKIKNIQNFQLYKISKDISLNNEKKIIDIITGL